MILRIHHKGLRELFETGRTRLIDARWHEACLDIMDHIDHATCSEDVQGVKGCHPLAGERMGVLSMKVTRNWRITFRFEGSDVTDVDLTDYH
jgi:proteic killer suppression protein